MTGDDVECDWLTIKLTDDETDAIQEIGEELERFGRSSAKYPEAMIAMTNLDCVRDLINKLMKIANDARTRAMETPNG
jgi:hypothetical protein